jgi:hypothetical protein
MMGLIARKAGRAHDVVNVVSIELAAPLRALPQIFHATLIVGPANF